MTTDIAPQFSPRQRLDQLRQADAQSIDPVRFHYLEALERRLREQGLQQGRHWNKLQQALDDYARKQPRNTHQSPDASIPANVSPLSELIERLNEQSPAPEAAKTSPLTDLLADKSSEPAEAARTSIDITPTNSPRPLRAMMRARALQDERTLERRIQSAIEHSPENAGPMNAHRLVSRAIGELQRLSPDYLKRFASYTDLLLNLEKLNLKG